MAITRTIPPLTGIPPQLFPRIDTAAAFTAADPVLLYGQAGYESDTGRLKIGDGATAWAALGYVTTPAAATGFVEFTIGGTTYKLLHAGTVP